MDLKIIRSGWVRGNTNGVSRMLTYDGKMMCCLGFLGKACGYSDDELRSRMNPGDVVTCATRQRNLFPRGTFGHTDESFGDPVYRKNLSDITKELIATNDSKYLTEKDREAEIVRLMRALDVIVTFED